MTTIMIRFAIPMTPRTKKNSSRIVVVKGRPIIIPSELYKQYEKECQPFIPKIETIDYPINLKCVYYMPTRRRVDLVNLLEATCDILVHYNLLKDDRSDIVYSHDGSYVSYDKDNPRVEIEIEEIKDGIYK